MKRHKILAIMAMFALVSLAACGDDDDSGNEDQNADDGPSAGSGAGTDTSASGGTGGELDAATEAGSGGSTDGEPDSGESCWPPDGVDRSHLSDVGTTDPLDYSDPGLWACHPDHDTDYCHTNIDATEVLKDGTYKPAPHARAADPEFDCFYVYPTVLLSGEPQQTDFSDIGIVADPLIAQAVPFTSVCEVYAPLYRQIGLNATAEAVEGANPALGLQDVRDAFAYYLENLNQGRDFVLMGHSQGTAMITAMMQRDVDEAPDVRAKMISALLIGGFVTVAEGELTGGTFKNIPLCSAPGETGCVVAYVSHAKEAPPPATSRFGTTTEEGQEVACTNPAVLAGNSGRFRGSYLRTSFCNPTFAPDKPVPAEITTSFALYRDIIRGECVQKNGFSYLEISVEQSEDDTREPPGYRTTLVEGIGMGLHLVDYNLPLDDLVDTVIKQAEAMP
ncbi:MAG: DUF3089 domain-containing protein [Deltaproteobacteria bacterium]|nr:DUF3089 domain-containing protein [Deltaproteobacteria bacterium]